MAELFNLQDLESFALMVNEHCYKTYIILHFKAMLKNIKSLLSFLFMILFLLMSFLQVFNLNFKILQFHVWISF